MVESKNIARLCERDATSIKIEVLGVIETYDYVKVLDFSSERKMMSVVMKNRETGVTKVYSKGASDSMQPRLASHIANSPEALADLSLANRYAAEGLRVLSFAVRDWDNEQNIENTTAEQFESGLDLVGITAVEDLLQEDVASCIEQFRIAGIKVWMLTGDKKETAMEIGQRCGLYDRGTMTIFQITESTNHDLLL